MEKLVDEVVCYVTQVQSAAVVSATWRLLGSKAGVRVDWQTLFCRVMVADAGGHEGTLYREADRNGHCRAW